MNEQVARLQGRLNIMQSQYSLEVSVRKAVWRNSSIFNCVEYTDAVNITVSTISSLAEMTLMRPFTEYLQHCCGTHHHYEKTLTDTVKFSMLFI